MSFDWNYVKWNPALYGIYKHALSDKQRYMVDDAMRGLPLIGSYLRARDNTRNMQSYLDRYGLDWSDIKNHKVALGYGNVARDSVTYTGGILGLYNTSRSPSRGNYPRHRTYNYNPAYGRW